MIDRSSQAYKKETFDFIPDCSTKWEKQHCMFNGFSPPTETTCVRCRNLTPTKLNVGWQTAVCKSLEDHFHFVWSFHRLDCLLMTFFIGAIRKLAMSIRALGFHEVCSSCKVISQAHRVFTKFDERPAD